MVFIIAFVLFILSIINSYISTRITDPIKELEKAVNEIEQGNLEVEVRSAGSYEIQHLGTSIQSMARRIRKLMNDIVAEHESKRRSEFDTLQSQINPHFLYNTLDMINWLSQTGRNQEVTQAIQALSRFYKLTLSRNGLMNSIETELQHVSLYIRLQNMRYDNCVTFVMDVPDELYDYTIPKLTFQPIVENAFLHGIMTTEQKKGSILLTGWKSGDDIGFIISDDGAGIPPEKLDTLMHDMVHAHMDAGVKQQASPGHIGIYNTNLRLKSLYGEMYGLSFTSTLGKGTEVTVRIPARHITDSLEQV